MWSKSTRMRINNLFLAGMSNKKIMQWDTRSGEIEQEYDRHLGPVNSIIFFDKNRRFVSTSDDKSLRIWEFGIPVDTKIIQHAGLHSIPSMTKAPNEKWIVGQSMDNRILLFQIMDDKLRFARKKAFRGHNTTGYACSSDFSPDMSFMDELAANKIRGGREKPFNFEEWCREIDQHPAFLTELKETDGGEYSAEVQAIQALKFDENDLAECAAAHKEDFANIKYSWALERTQKEFAWDVPTTSSIPCSTQTERPPIAIWEICSRP